MPASRQRSRLPEEDAFYLNVDPGFPPGEYQITVRDAPVDGFWSISVYNADGYFQPNDRNAYSINNITATPNPDGSVTVHFGGCGDDRPNCLPIVDGWNYAVRPTDRDPKYSTAPGPSPRPNGHSTELPIARCAAMAVTR